MNLYGIPIIQPMPLVNDPCGPCGSPQPILQLKELEVDQVRYEEWKMSLKRHWNRTIREEQCTHQEPKKKGGPMSS